jgi:hypothetical protein
MQEKLENTFYYKQKKVRKMSIKFKWNQISMYKSFDTLPWRLGIQKENG